MLGGWQSLGWFRHHPEGCCEVREIFEFLLDHVLGGFLTGNRGVQVMIEPVDVFHPAAGPPVDVVEEPVERQVDRVYPFGRCLAVDLRPVGRGEAVEAEDGTVGRSDHSPMR